METETYEHDSEKSPLHLDSPDESTPEEKLHDLLFDTDELIELIYRTGTLDDLSAFVRGDDDAIWGFKKRILAAAEEALRR